VIAARRALVVAAALGSMAFPGASDRTVAAASAFARPPDTGAPAYYRPVLAGGNAFPLARSNYLSIIEIHHNWHALRLRLIDGTWQPVGVHEGIDITAEEGTPILSMTPGVVEAVGWTFYSGTRVGVRGDDGLYYFYAHLSAVAAGILPGARVSPGRMLGRVGNTGYGDPGHKDEFPPHLHFGIESGATWINPHPLLVSLYDATVKANDWAQARLDELATARSWSAWEQRAGETYTTFAS
jgi:murein DD-endopeptidase MepM/ murein hydrolase activator NlpD